MGFEAGELFKLPDPGSPNFQIILVSEYPTAVQAVTVMVGAVGAVNDKALQLIAMLGLYVKGAGGIFSKIKLGRPRYERPGDIGSPLLT